MATVIDGLLLRTRVFEDIGLAIEPSDLERLAANFRPVPILYEHLEAGLDFGELREVWVQGDALYGKLAFYPEAWALLNRKGLKGLSVAMPYSKTRLLEVSITSNPREKDARLLASEDSSEEARVYIMGELQNEVVYLSEGADTREATENGVSEPVQVVALAEPAPEDTITLSSAEYRQLRLQVEKLRYEQRLSRARETARSYRDQGYITPAQEALLTALLATEGAETVRFSYEGAERTLGELLIEFVKLNQRFGVGETLGASASPASTYDLSRLGMSKEGEHLARLFLEGRFAEAEAYRKELMQGGTR